MCGIGQIDRHIGGAGRGRAHHGYLATIRVGRQLIVAIDGEIGRQLVVGPILQISGGVVHVMKQLVEAVGGAFGGGVRNDLADRVVTVTGEC